jgi:hypothetical protein
MQGVIIVGLVMIGVYLFLRWSAKPIHYRHLTSTDFQSFTESLFSQGGGGALLFIHHEGTDRFVQFAKYLSPKRMIHFGFPDAPWSRSYFPAVQNALSAAGFSCYESPTKDDHQTLRFLCIDDISTGRKAAEIALIAFTAMGLGAEATYTIHQEGSISLKEWKRYEAIRKQDVHN